MNKRFIHRVAALLVLCCVLFGCKPEQNGSIYGVVTDLKSGEPVSHANVQLRPGGETSLTGSDGNYEFLDVQSGTYSIKVTKEGYTDLIDDFDIVVTSGKSSKRDVQIMKLPSLLRIYDDSGNEISELDFGADEGVTQRTISILNDGSNSLRYTITKSADWISHISQSDGTIESGKTCTIVITIDRALLADGSNTTKLIVTSPGDGGKELTVKARKGGSDSDLVFEISSAKLMVQKEDLGFVDWESAKLLCENSNVAEYNDWRLPTKEELSVLYTKRNEIGGFTDGKYWSSTPKGGYRYAINFGNGMLDYEEQQNKYHVRAVRTMTNQNATIELPTANLMVQTQDLGCVPLNSAKLMCESSIVAGYSDWRLPTQNELMVLYNNKDYIGGFNEDYYWSSDENYQGPVVVYFYDGSLNWAYSSSSHFVRAVRNLDGSLLSIPTITTSTPTDVTENSAKCGGNVTSDGGASVIQRGVCYGTSQNPTTSDICVESGTGMGSFTCNLTSLSANTKYYVRAYATNSKGTAYGEQKEFTTAAPSPTTFEYAGTTYYVHPEVGTMTWQSAVDYCNNLTFAGYSDWYLPNKDELNAMYVYRNTIGGFYNSYYWSSTASTTSSAWYQSFSDGSQNTKSKTNYYRVRPVRREGGGPTPTPVAPTVTTSTPTNVTESSAKCGGNVTSDGGANVAQRGVCYSTSPNPTTSSQTVSGGSGTGSFTCSLTGLSANTTYYVRAYAVNSVGTAYGEQKSFTTDGGPTTATIILVAGNIWGDGTGYQMLLDKTHSLYGTIIPTDGALSASCSGNETLYSLFDFKIPENADGNCTTQNIVINNTVTLTIPAGIYDWCITNPTPGDCIWIASSQGNVGGRQDDYEFEAGNIYEFTVTLVGENDAVNVVITGGGKGKKSMGQSNENSRRK